MIEKIINTIIPIIVSGVLGYCISIIKNYILLKKALMTILQNHLTSTYYVYENLEKIPDYVYRNWKNSQKIYEQLGGNDYVHVLDEKMRNWDFEQTDILKK